MGRGLEESGHILGPALRGICWVFSSGPVSSGPVSAKCAVILRFTCPGVSYSQNYCFYGHIINNPHQLTPCFKLHCSTEGPIQNDLFDVTSLNLLPLRTPPGTLIACTIHLLT